MEIKVEIKHYSYVIDILKEVGIVDYIIDLNNHALTILCFDVNNIYGVMGQATELKELLKDNYDGTEKTTSGSVTWQDKAERCR